MLMGREGNSDTWGGMMFCTFTEIFSFYGLDDFQLVQGRIFWSQRLALQWPGPVMPWSTHSPGVDSLC